MKIFFIASIYGSERFGKNYEAIVDLLKEEGHTVYAGHIFGVSAKDLQSWDDEKDIQFHKKVLAGIKRADLVVAELSYSSTSVGYLASIAVESGKPTIAFYSGKETPHLLKTIVESEKFQVVHYNTMEELKKEIASLIDYAIEQRDTRFNFFVSRKLTLYLNWISQKKRIPRAVYLRQLIRREMRNTRWTLAES